MAPAPTLFYLTQPNQDTGDFMKSMMYFDPPLQTSIRLYILLCPYLILQPPQSDVVSHPNWHWLLAVANLGSDKIVSRFRGGCADVFSGCILRIVSLALRWKVRLHIYSRRYGKRAFVFEGFLDDHDKYTSKWVR